jgi:ATP-dependent protease ClpP protease subunit
MDLKRLHNLVSSVSERTSLAERAATTGGNSWYRISNSAGDSTRIDINGEIGDWGITSAEFANAIADIKTSSVKLHINSPGGSVFEGLGIYENIVQHPAHWEASIDGVAASAASFIAMACDSIKMGKRARMMIHDAAGGCIGTEADMLEMAALLKDLSDNCADIYAERAGGTRDEWRARMRAGSANSGTWLSADAAIELKLADGIIGAESKNDPAPAEDEKINDSLDLDALRAALEGAFK